MKRVLLFFPCLGDQRTASAMRDDRTKAVGREMTERKLMRPNGRKASILGPMAANVEKLEAQLKLWNAHINGLAAKVERKGP